MRGPTEPMRVVVCGSTFGRVYLDALDGAPDGCELAGVLTHGSERSRREARERGVPHYTSVGDLPDDVDAACVVVRSGLLGGSGTQLATDLLDRGVHVLQEHPVHHDELAECLRLAHRRGVQYHLNTFYHHLAPVRAFLAAARRLVRTRRPLYVDATAGFPVGFALLDLIGSALGGLRPWSFGPLAEAPDLAEVGAGAVQLRVLMGSVGGVPVTLRVQNQLDPDQPDRPTELLHGLTLGVEGGALHLVSTHGPTVWTSRPRLPGAAGHGPAVPWDGAPAAVVVDGTRVPSFEDCVTTLWPEGVRGALAGLRDAVDAGDSVLRRGQHHLSLCQAWHDLAVRLGPPELVTLAPPEPLSAAELAPVLAAARDAAR